MTHVCNLPFPPRRSPIALRKHRRRTSERCRNAVAAFVVGASCVAVSACNESSISKPVAPPLASATKFWESNAAVYWNNVARSLVIKNRSNPFQALRGYAIVSVAQYNAAVAAEQEKQGGVHASGHAAIASASVITLSYLHPGDAAALETQLAQFLAADTWPGDAQTDAVQGEAVGRAVGQQVVARAQTDRFFAPWSGTVPTGPGLWFSSAVPPAPPVGAMFGQAKTYFLTSGDQFRLPPPPAFGSPEFNAALAEVRQISDTRTPEQIASARFWAFEAGTYGPPGYWNELAAELATRYRVDERKTAHMFALMNMVGFDAVVASHDTKFTYWLIRPTQADPAITLPIGLPNFPSYASNHAAVSAGMTTILGTIFPAEKQRLDELAEEAALSRLYGGIHYRFDCDAGLVLGRQVAAYALSLDVNGHEPYALN